MKLLIADDHAMHRELTHHIVLSRYPDATVLEAKDFEETLRHCSAFKPDVLLLDIVMPKMKGLIGIKKLISDFPYTKVLICSASDNPVLVTTIKAIGASGFVSKVLSVKQLIVGINRVINGKKFFPTIANDLGTKKLTLRQIEVLGMICSGKSNKEMASYLNLSLHTIKFHTSLILKKLNVNSRQQLLSLISFTAF